MPMSATSIPSISNHVWAEEAPLYDELSASSNGFGSNQRILMAGNAPSSASSLRAATNLSEGARNYVIVTLIGPHDNSTSSRQIATYCFTAFAVIAFAGQEDCKGEGGKRTNQERARMAASNGNRLCMRLRPCCMH